jgi:hypothetical protein
MLAPGTVSDMVWTGAGSAENAPLTVESFDTRWKDMQ